MPRSGGVAAFLSEVGRKSRAFPHIEGHSPKRRVVQVVCESIQQRSGLFAVRGVDEHAGGFVDYDQVGVFEDDVESDLFGTH